jgi:hypothetical protein
MMIVQVLWHFRVWHGSCMAIMEVKKQSNNIF